MGKIANMLLRIVQNLQDINDKLSIIDNRLQSIDMSVYDTADVIEGLGSKYLDDECDRLGNGG